MSKRISEEQSVALATLIILMNIPKEDCLEILTAIDTPAEFCLFLDKLAEKDFNMTPQEVNQALLDTIVETM